MGGCHWSFAPTAKRWPRSLCPWHGNSSWQVRTLTDALFRLFGKDCLGYLAPNCTLASQVLPPLPCASMAQVRQGPWLRQGHVFASKIKADSSDSSGGV